MRLRTSEVLVVVFRDNGELELLFPERDHCRPYGSSFCGGCAACLEMQTPPEMRLEITLPLTQREVALRVLEALK